MDTVSIISQVYDINCFYASFGFTKKYSRTWFLKKYMDDMLLLTIDHYLDKVLGFACAYNLTNIPNYVNLALLCVHKDYVRQKIGSKLIDEFRKKFKDKHIALNVRKTNLVGIAFYKDSGFEKIKEYEDSLLLIKK
jgi:ribosomal protein S18 acetylase RimI-like enzyme